MAPTQPHPQPRRSRNLPVLPILLIVLLLGLALFGDKGIMRMLQAHRQKASLEQKLTELKAKNAALRQEITALRSDRHYIEEVARQELGMVKKGELIYQFPSKKKGREKGASSGVPGKSGQ
jgi:cell division protein FtsB